MDKDSVIKRAKQSKRKCLYHDTISIIKWYPKHIKNTLKNLFRTPVPYEDYVPYEIVTKSTPRAQTTQWPRAIQKMGSIPRMEIKGDCICSKQ